MSPRAARTLAQAKINLALRVLGKEPDGYHAIETVFQRVELGDDVELRITNGRRSLKCYEMRDWPPEGNLGYRAAALFAAETGWPKGFETVEGPRRYSGYPKLTIIFTAILAVAGVIALFSEPIRQGGLQTLGNLAIQNSLKLGGITALSVAFILVLRTMSWPFPFLALRYWPRENEAAEPASRLPICQSPSWEEGGF